MNSEYKMKLAPINIEEANNEAKPVLEQALKEVGFIPNMYMNMVNSPALLSSYLHGYALFRNNTGLKPEEQEVIFLTISDENDCHYCAAAHSMLADKKSGVAKENINAIRNNKQLTDEKLNQLSVFTRKMVQSRGLPSMKDVNDFLHAGYTEKDILHIILAISVKVLSNYSNHIFHTEIDGMFSDYA